MRYSAIAMIMIILALTLPVKKLESGQGRTSYLAAHTGMKAPSVDSMFSQQTQNEVDSAMAQLRALPPTQQLMFMMQVIIMMMCGASIVSYMLHSFTSLAGFGLTLSILLFFTTLLVIAILTGRKKPRLMKWIEKYTEMGPFFSRLKTRGWKKRFARAAAEHGFHRTHAELVPVRVYR